MKWKAGLIAVIALGLAALIGWFAYVKRVERELQADPVQAVTSFMKAAQTISSLMWEEEEREALKQELDEWKKAEGKTGKKAPLFFERYDLQDPSRLFVDKSRGKAAFGALLLFQFDSFTVEQKKSNGKSAVVDVSFVPLDILGLRQMMEGMGAPSGEIPERPIKVRFLLQRRWLAWYIVGVEGELQPLIEGFRGMRKFD
jgi:hypothetical protein